MAKLQMSGVPNPDTPDNLTLAFLALLEREIIWCEQNPDKAFTADYRKGFVNGLVQARILIANADKMSRERP